MNSTSWPTLDTSVDSHKLLEHALQSSARVIQSANIFQLVFHFNITESDAVYFWAYNKDQYSIPDNANLFGGSNGVTRLKHCNRAIGCHQMHSITWTRWKAINHKDHPCDDSGRNSNTSACISNFIRDKVGCYVPLQNMEPGGLPPCNHVDQGSYAKGHALLKISMVFGVIVLVGVDFWRGKCLNNVWPHGSRVSCNSCPKNQHH